MARTTKAGRKANAASPPLNPADIAAVRIYPPIGLARVGNAPEDFLIGTEVIGGDATRPDGTPARTLDDYRGPAPDRAIKRHAARFRIYAEMKDGAVVELTRSSGVGIRWQVALANLKAGWYDFNQAMDLGDPVSQPAQQRNRQLPRIPGGRGSLDIVPTSISIDGANLSGSEYTFGDGLFCAKQVYLGELRTDAEGRLLVLGGRGLSASFRPNLQPVTFANNFGWHDDVSDGPVRATITFADGTSVEAEAAYVAVTPPNFAPGLVPVVTMDDTVRETFYDAGWLERPKATSFTRDVWPIFDRLTGLQWTNHGLFVVHGAGSPLDARDPQVIARLRDAKAGQADWRRRVFALFRDPLSTAKYAPPPVPPVVPPMIPQIFGDAYGETAAENDGDPRVELSISPTQYAHLGRWAAGKFADDWPGAIPQPPRFDDLTPADQVAQLERASLHDCIGGPFHPGIELTWTMRLPRVWARAYRLKVLPGDGAAKQDYGKVLTPDACMAAGGPYDGVAAGALTRFLGVPWQTDGTSCNSDADYAPWTFLSMPTFWGARVPDQVFAEANYARTQDLEPALSRLQIDKHFALRVDWLRDVRGRDYYDRLSNMIANWAGLGMVIPGVDPPAWLPAGVRVEQGRVSQAGTDPKRHLVAEVEALAYPVKKVGPARKKALMTLDAIDEATPPAPGRRHFRRDEV
jgi:L-lysine epsilon oxidase-like protein